jgi:hypothetical protein
MAEPPAQKLRLQNLAFKLSSLLRVDQELDTRLANCLSDPVVGAGGEQRRPMGPKESCVGSLSRVCLTPPESIN